MQTLRLCTELYLSQAQLGSNLLHSHRFGVLQQLQAVLGANLEKMEVVNKSQTNTEGEAKPPNIQSEVSQRRTIEKEVTLYFKGSTYSKHDTNLL